MIKLTMSGLAYSCIENHIDDIANDNKDNVEFCNAIRNFESNKKGKGYTLTFTFANVYDALEWINVVRGYGDIGKWSNAGNSDYSARDYSEFRAARNDAEKMTGQLNEQGAPGGLQHLG